MADRKVLVKYFPKNFDHERLVKRGRGRDKLMIVRNMLPMSLRCNTCSNYLYIGTKFNMRMEIANDEMYLGIKVFRFYLKCTTCYAEITFKTDPKNHDYVVETGGTRNYEPIKDAQHAEKLLRKMRIEEKECDSMKYLENKSYDSKRQMELMQALDDIKNLNKRNAVIDPEVLLKTMFYEQQMKEKFTEEEEAEYDRQYDEMRRARLAELFTIDESAQHREENISHNNSREGEQHIGGLQYNKDDKKKSNGKHLPIFTPTKSKLDKYKKKIIRKEDIGKEIVT